MAKTVQNTASPVTVPMIYNGIATISQSNLTFVINLPYTWSGTPAPTMAPQPSCSIISELDATGKSSQSSASIAVLSTSSTTCSNSTGSFAITMEASNLLPTTTAVNFIFNASLNLSFNPGNTLTMTYGQVVINPANNYWSLQINVTPATALQATPTLSSITSNSTYPGPAATSPPAASPGTATPEVTTVGTTVTIPVTVPPNPPSQTYLGIVFVVKMIFGSAQIIVRHGHHGHSDE